MDEPSTFPYRLRQEFLSPAEAAFFRVLHEMVKEHLYICPKVPLQELFFVTRPNENVHYFNKIYRKSVDFLLLRRDTLKPVLAIELDYPKQAEHRPRDNFLESLFIQARLPLVHVLAQPSYDMQELARLFARAMKQTKVENQPMRAANDYSPICPRCGITMVLRFYKEGPRKGQQYYGCLNFPQCQETVQVGH
ncbi:MAG: topoisomerase [Anaerolineae bacterium]|nr:MAG: topoisomerase [Anaerolineae bacterium]